MNTSSTYKLPLATAPGYRTTVNDSLASDHTHLNQEGRATARAKQQATHCSEHDAHDKIANIGWPALPLSLTTNLPSTDVDHNNNALTVQAGTQHAEYDNERGCGSSMRLSLIHI